MTHPVGRYRKTVFNKGNQPAYYYCFPQRPAVMLNMIIQSKVMKMLDAVSKIIARIENGC
jgi:hypothetical protein